MKQQVYTGSILKWIGGKEKELPLIMSSMPEHYNGYYEPFVGGGACYLAAEAEHYHINDRCEELIQLYRNIISNKKFYEYVRCINQAWKSIAFIFYSLESEIVGLYRDFSIEKIKYTDLDNEVRAIVHHISFRDIFMLPFPVPEAFELECRFNVVRSMHRMVSAQKNGVILNEKEVSSNLKTAFKASVYTYLREIFNTKTIQAELHSALFLFLTTYSLNGHFRYRDNGKFNMPYAGKAYNDKYLDSRISYYRSDALREKLANTTIGNADFSTFFKRNKPSSDDFIFLDPPDEGIYNRFGRYGFGREDHKRLAEYLLNECVAKWMLIVKDTETVRHLYFYNGLSTLRYGKAGKQLLITNYDINSSPAILGYNDSGLSERMQELLPEMD